LTQQSFGQAAFSVEVFTSAVPLSAKSCVIFKGDPIVLDANTYGLNEYTYGKDVGLAVFLACQNDNLKQRIYNAGTGVVTGPEELAQVVRDLSPNIKVTVSGVVKADRNKAIPLDLTTSKTELGYAPRFPLKEALRDYMDELWRGGSRG
jgi:nucleoside-diphosphate-sugar epimerase